MRKYAVDQLLADIQEIKKNPPNRNDLVTSSLADIVLSSVPGKITYDAVHEVKSDTRMWESIYNIRAKIFPDENNAAFRAKYGKMNTISGAFKIMNAVTIDAASFAMPLVNAWAISKYLNMDSISTAATYFAFTALGCSLRHIASSSYRAGEAIMDYCTSRIEKKFAEIDKD
jgi:hypothetical protein